MSDSLRPHESQHTRPPCPSPTPRVYSNPRPSSRWCHPAISSFVVPFSSCPQSLPASGSFPMSQLFAWGGQSIGYSISQFKKVTFWISRSRKELDVPPSVCKLSLNLLVFETLPSSSHWFGKIKWLIFLSQCLPESWTFAFHILRFSAGL